MAEIKTVNLEVNSNLAQTEKAVTSLKTELRKAQQEVASLSDKFGATSKEAIEAAKRAADLKDRIGDAKDLTDAFNPDAKFKALAGAANIAAGALAGFEGAMGLVGVQSEDAQQAILKVQSALAVSQGLDVLQQIPDTFKNIKAVAINAFQGIKTAIGATGIGLLVVALGAVYANWDALKKLVGDSVPALKEGTKQFDKLKEVFFGVGNAIVQYLLTPFKAVLKLLQLDFKGAIQEIKNGADVIGNYEKGAAKERQNQNDAYAKARLEKQIKNKENEIAIAKAAGKDTYDLEKINLHRKLILNKDNQEELEKLRQEERLLDATHKKSLEDKQKAHNDELKRKRDEAIAEEKRKREEAEKERRQFENQKGRKAEEEYDAILKREEEAREKNRLAGLTEIEQVEEKYNKLIETAKAAGVSTIELEIEKANAINDINVNLQNKLYADLQAAYEREAALDLAIREAKRNALDTGLNILLQFAGKNKTIALGILAIQKGLAIADIVVGASKSIAAAQAALAATPAVIGVVPNPMYAVQAAATIKGIALTKITAATSIASILAASIGQAKSITGGGGGGSAPSGGGGGGSAAPQFNVVGNSGVNQLAQTMSGQSEQAPIQAYVVAQNVTSAQSLNRNIVNNASLG
jgi:hypothetical protein